MCSKAWIDPPSNDTSSGSAPASSRACHGRSSSTCSTPSVASTATFIPSSSPAMGRRYPEAEPGTPARTTVSGMSAPTRAAGLRLLDRSLVRRLLIGVQPAGPALEDALRAAAEVIAGGRPAAVRHVPGGAADARAELGELIARVHAAGLAASVELTLPVDRLGTDVASELGRRAQDAGLAVALEGAP